MFIVWVWMGKYLLDGVGKPTLLDMFKDSTKLYSALSNVD